MNQNRRRLQAADYEQELYEKDQYIQRLENEIGGLKASTHPLFRGEDSVMSTEQKITCDLCNDGKRVITLEEPNRNFLVARVKMEN